MSAGAIRQNFPKDESASWQGQILEFEGKGKLFGLGGNLPFELERFADAAAFGRFFSNLKRRGFIPFAAHAKSFGDQYFAIAIDQAEGVAGENRLLPLFGEECRLE